MPRTKFARGFRSTPDDCTGALAIIPRAPITGYGFPTVISASECREIWSAASGYDCATTCWPGFADCRIDAWLPDPPVAPPLGRLFGNLPAIAAVFTSFCFDAIGTPFYVTPP
jgi:hypothetical protein